MPEPDLSARVEALEVRIAHQDAVIDDLNATVTAQWGRIDALVRQVRALADQVKDAESRAATAVPALPPPHY